MGAVYSAFLLSYMLFMTPGGWFADRLGPATMDASFSARRDEATSRRIEAVVNEILSRVGPAEGSATPVSAP